MHFSVLWKMRTFHEEAEQRKERGEEDLGAWHEAKNIILTDLSFNFFFNGGFLIRWTDLKRFKKMKS